MQRENGVLTKLTRRARAGQLSKIIPVSVGGLGRYLERAGAGAAGGTT
jgi:hypothetical protein